MAEKKIGAGIALDGEKEFKKAISEINKDMKILASEMKKVTAEFSDNAESMEALTSKSAVLNKQIDEQKKKVETLKAALENSAKEFGENDTRTKNWQVSLAKAEADLAQTESALRKTTKEMNDLGKESEEGGNKLKDAGKAAEDSKPKFEKLGSALKTSAVAMGAVAAAAGAAAVKLGSEIVKQFGELEQNLGGSEAVFGEYAKSIQKTGEEAYKNLGVSQSEYLATANKMGALFQGSGIEQQKSLELTEKAMQRAADMASVMGIDMQQALDSIAGAAKGNFTMMDNLGVAMNATSIEAYAVGKGFDFVWSKASQAEKAEMAMQMFFESTEQYAGNFAKESTTTVTGSLGLLQAAVGSFTAGLGNADADMQNLTANMIDAFKSVVTNITPIIENLTEALPDAFDAMIGALGDLLPTLLDTVTSLFKQVLDTLLKLLPELIPVAVEAIMTIVDTLIENLPMLIDGAFTLVTTLAEGIIEALPELVPKIVEVVTQIVTTMIENLPLIIDAALQIIIALASGLIQAIPELVKSVPELINSIVTAFSDSRYTIVEIGKNVVRGIWEGITGMAKWLANKVKDFVDGIVDAFTGKEGIDARSPSKLFAKFGGYMAQGIGEGFTSEMQNVAQQINRSIPVVNGSYDISGSISNKGSISAGVNQVINIYSPTPLTPSQIARENKNALRRLAWA